MTPRARQLTVGLLIDVHLLLALAAPLMMILGQPAFMIPLGLWMGQITLGATWWAWRPVSWRSRLGVCGLLATVCGLASIIYGIGRSDPVFDTLLIWITLTEFFLAQVVLLTIARKLFRLRLTHSEDPVSWTFESQFSIRDLLVFTAMIGILLALGRLPFMLTISGKRPGETDSLGTAIFWAVIIGTVILMLVGLIVGLFTTFAALARRRAIPMTILLAMLALGCVLLTLVAGPKEISMAALFTGAEVATIVASLWVLRACGYRLQWWVTSPKLPAQPVQKIP